MKFLKPILILLIINSLFTLAVFSQKEPVMVFVKGGAFRMGSNDGYDDEKPIHTVIVSDFYISKYEVTVAEYKAFCNETGRRMPSDPNKAWYEEHDNATKWKWIDNHPIVKVTWYDAIAYCKWLSKKTGKTYTLPSEAQWEYAARGGAKSKGYKYSGSNNINVVAWYDETTYEKGLRPIGRLKANELGIHDMSGNAWEWCYDKYGTYPSSTQKDPKGPSKGMYRVIRGGSWYYVSDMARVTARDGPLPHYTNYNYGFRLIRK